MNICFIFSEIGFLSHFSSPHAAPGARFEGLQNRQLVLWQIAVFFFALLLLFQKRAKLIALRLYLRGAIRVEPLKFAFMVRLENVKFFALSRFYRLKFRFQRRILLRQIFRLRDALLEGREDSPRIFVNKSPIQGIEDSLQCVGQRVHLRKPPKYESITAMANRKPAPDINAAAAEQVRNTTDSPPEDGAELIGDPKLREAYIELKKWGREREEIRRRRAQSS